MIPPTISIPGLHLTARYVHDPHIYPDDHSIEIDALLLLFPPLAVAMVPIHCLSYRLYLYNEFSRNLVQRSFCLQADRGRLGRQIVGWCNVYKSSPDLHYTSCLWVHHRLDAVAVAYPNCHWTADVYETEVWLAWVVCYWLHHPHHIDCPISLVATEFVEPRSELVLG